MGLHYRCLARTYEEFYGTHGGEFPPQPDWGERRDMWLRVKDDLDQESAQREALWANWASGQDLHLEPEWYDFEEANASPPQGDANDPAAASSSSTTFVGPQPAPVINQPPPANPDTSAPRDEQPPPVQPTPPSDQPPNAAETNANPIQRRRAHMRFC